MEDFTISVLPESRVRRELQTSTTTTVVKWASYTIKDNMLTITIDNNQFTGTFKEKLQMNPKDPKTKIFSKQSQNIFFSDFPIKFGEYIFTVSTAESVIKGAGSATTAGGATVMGAALIVSSSQA